MNDEHDLLNERLDNYGGTYGPSPTIAGRLDEVPRADQSKVATDMDFSLWQIGANGTYRPGSRTVAKLPSGSYRVGKTEYGIFFSLLNPLSDEIAPLPDTANERVLFSIRKFWESRARYQRHGLLYKRGILLWGPPGSGKTVTVQLLARELVSAHSGIVMLCDYPLLMTEALQVIRTVERHRPLIVVLEDVDELIDHHGEHAILAMLDGEHQTDNVVYLATTNYPEKLGARIVNRPSRFDERIMVDMPTSAARRAYLTKATAIDPLAESEMDRWVLDTEHLSVAHLRELVAAVACLGQDYTEVLARLKKMCSAPKAVSGFGASGGFGLAGLSGSVPPMTPVPRGTR